MKAFLAALVLLIGMDLVANEIYDCDESGCYSEGDLDEGEVPHVYRALDATIFGRGFDAYFGGFAPEWSGQKEMDRDATWIPGKGNRWQ